MATAGTLSRIPWLALTATLALFVCSVAGLARGDELYAGMLTVPRQAVWIGLSLAAMAAAVVVPYRKLKGSAYLLWLGCLVLLVLVLLSPPRNGSRSWFGIGPFTFQPSEFSKLAYVLALSRYLMFSRNHRTLFGLMIPFALTVPMVVLILREPDLGTASIFFPVLFCMLFAAGARTRDLLLILLMGGACVPVLWREMNAEQRSRITSMFRQKDGGGPLKGDDFHLHQSKQVIGLGSVWGSDLTGMAVAESQAYKLPAARTDFVFCLIGERWGFWGTSVVLAAYLMLIGGSLRVGAQTEDPFGRLICVGIAGWFGTQVVINTGMTVGLAPITGITLPLVSYGGSSMLASCLAVGLVVNVSLRRGYEAAGQPFRF